MWANAQPDGRPAEHRWRPLFNAAKFGPVFAASRVQRISDLHSKFALRPHHVPKYGRLNIQSPTAEIRRGKKERRKKKKQNENIIIDGHVSLVYLYNSTITTCNFFQRRLYSRCGLVSKPRLLSSASSL